MIKGRIGPQMQRLLDYVAAHPGCSSLEARSNAIVYRRGWSNIYSDAVLNRCRQKNLIRVEQNGNRLALFVV